MLVFLQKILENTSLEFVKNREKFSSVGSIFWGLTRVLYVLTLNYWCPLMKNLFFFLKSKQSRISGYFFLWENEHCFPIFITDSYSYLRSTQRIFLQKIVVIVKIGSRELTEKYPTPFVFLLSFIRAFFSTGT